jgi:hypothetical protein
MESEAPDAAYAAACIELYSRLWWELEELTQSFVGDESSHSQLDSRLVLLRLETIVLIDSCDSTKLRSLLGGSERRDLRATLESLLAALEEGLLQHAQNRLLDTVLAILAPLIRSAAADRGAGHIPRSTDAQAA